MKKKCTGFILSMVLLCAFLSCNIKEKGSDQGKSIETEVRNNLAGDVAQFKGMPENKPIRIGVNDTIDCLVQSHYRYHKDGSPGRELTLVLKDNRYEGNVEVTLSNQDKYHTANMAVEYGTEEYSVLLPQGVAVEKDEEVNISIEYNGELVRKRLTIPKKRQWTVYLYPHSHVDIGYTNTQENCELIHTRNLVEGIKLGKRTFEYPREAQYLWNPEVLWAVERYLAKATPTEKEFIMDGIEEGYLSLDAGYANIMTSVASGEELIAYFQYGEEYEALTGKPIETLVQVDVPGMTWGMVPVATKLGIKYCLSFNNGYDRVGRSILHSFKPFWWTDVTGNNKILFLQAGSYNPGALIKGHQFWPQMAGQTDSTKLIKVVKTDAPRENFVDAYINRILPELEKSDFYPYDIFVMSWAMADNTPIDADLPDAVKSWNEEYAYPKLVIAGATDIMKDFEDKYGDRLPVLKGDFTEHWTDGLGTAARQTAINRETKERLVQAETLWSMLRPLEDVPRKDFKEAWRNVLLGTEHTWCYMAPDQQPLSNDILHVKYGYFNKAKKLSEKLLSSALEPFNVLESGYIAVFNTLSWNRSGIVVLPVEQAKGYRGIMDTNGNLMPSQLLSTGELVFMANDVPAFGAKKYQLVNKPYNAKDILVKDYVLDNGMLKVSLDLKTGDINSILLDGKEFVKQTGKSYVNTYKYIEADKAPETALGVENVKLEVLENGPLVGKIAAISEAAGAKNLVREITIYKDLPQIEIKNVIDKFPIKDKEGVHFGFAFNIRDPKMVADIPWGKMQLDDEQLIGANRNWLAMQRWMEISDGERSVVWSSLDAPVYQVGNITANIIGSASQSDQWIPRLDQNGTVYSWAMNNHWHTNFQLTQEGKTVFRYSILPRTSKGDIGLANKFGYAQFQPLIVSEVDSTFDREPMVMLEGSTAVFATIAKSVDKGRALLIRLRSLSDRDETIRLSWVARKPKASYYYQMDNGQLGKELGDSITVPAMDFMTIKVVW